ncbi:MAG TPA: hypothetical protein VKU44_01995 [Terriglobia bacterium]|nr:hypothetical protein [Terriglobia bacterium]
MDETTPSPIELVCPCCGARLKVDREFGKVIGHEAPRRETRGPDLDRAAVLLQKRAEERDAHFRQSAEDEKVKSRLLERKFEEALAKAKDQPVTRPARDIDLD